MDRWILDQVIDLNGVCDRFGWEPEACVAALVEFGIAPPDAHAFIAFALAARANPNAGSEARLSFRQWSRLRAC